MSVSWSSAWKRSNKNQHPENHRTAESCTCVDPGKDLLPSFASWRLGCFHLFCVDIAAFLFLLVGWWVNPRPRWTADKWIMLSRYWWCSKPSWPFYFLRNPSFGLSKKWQYPLPWCRCVESQVPKKIFSGTHTKNYGKLPCLTFNSKLVVITRGYHPMKSHRITIKSH